MDEYRKDLVGLVAFAELVALKYQKRDPLTVHVIHAFARLIRSYIDNNELK